MAVNVPQELGGAGAGVVAYALAMQEIARGVRVDRRDDERHEHGRRGDRALRDRRAEGARTVRGSRAASTRVGSFALSEPDAGSDPGAMRTTARRDGDAWVLDGAKQWITSGAYAGVFVVWARTGAARRTGTRGISCFLVEGGRPGLKVGRPEDKMGIRGSNTVPLEFDGLPRPGRRAPRRGERRLQDRDDGARRRAHRHQLAGHRHRARRARGERRATPRTGSSSACRSREHPGHPVEARRHADRSSTRRTSCRMRAAWLKEQGRPFSREASMAKLFASEAAMRVCNDAVQIHGGYGYTREFAAERHLRDARVTTIYEGTSEIQRLVIARSVLA